MADAFAGVVMLLVAAYAFRLRAEHHWLYPKSDPDCHFWPASIVLMLVQVILTMLAAAMTTGSGNAPFTPFVEMTKPAHLRYQTQPIYPSQQRLPQNSGRVIDFAGPARRPLSPEWLKYHRLKW